VAQLSELLGLSEPGTADYDRGFIVVVECGSQAFGIVVDGVFHTEEIVVKPMSSKLRDLALFSGNTILGDGAVIMIVDPNGVLRAIGSSVAARLAVQEHTATVLAKRNTEDEAKTSLLVFRAGSAKPKAVPLALITRLEEIDATTIELSNGRHMVQYRGQLMPLIGMNEDVKVKGEGAQPLLVFSDGTRSMALVVDEIVDIVEEHLDIQVAANSQGVIGSAIIKGQATEIVDVGHLLPLAFADWFRGKAEGAPARTPRVLLVDDSPFFRNMLAPVLQAAGYKVAAAGSGHEALELIEKGSAFDILVTDIDMPEMNGFGLVEKLRNGERPINVPVIGLSSNASVEDIENGRHAGFYDIVAKFDRQGLIAALKEQADIGRAA
jgi:two-component system chemotaxis sensor kinase CheA